MRKVFSWIPSQSVILFWYWDNQVLEIRTQSINIFANVLRWISRRIAILTLILPSGNNSFTKKHKTTPKSRAAEGCPGFSLYGIFNRKFADSVDGLRILTNRVKTLHKKRWKGWQTRKISLLYMCRQRKSRCLSTLHFLMNPFREEAAGTDFYLFTSA